MQLLPTNVTLVIPEEELRLCTYLAWNTDDSRLMVQGLSNKDLGLLATFMARSLATGQVCEGGHTHDRAGV